jgi:CheY-like chemotaxis protein
MLLYCAEIPGGERLTVKNNCVILLVEDDPNDIALIKLGFSKVGILNPLVVISDGEKAIEYFSGQEPYADREKFPLAQLILLDLALPRRTGFEVLEWVRSQAQLRHVPVIVLTGSTLAVDVRHAYQLGANSFLTKPADLPELILSLKEMTDFWLGRCELPEAPEKRHLPPFHINKDQMAA